MADTTNTIATGSAAHPTSHLSLVQIFGHHVFVKLLANILAL
jgi:hypothetical protein